MALGVAVAFRGELGRILASEEQAAAQAVATTVRRRVSALKRALRREVARAGLGRLQNAVRSKVEPRRGPSLDAHGTVYSSARVKGRAGGAVDLLAVFETGETIRARGGTYLAIPARGQPRGERPKDFPAGALHFRGRRGAETAVLVDASGTVRFILLRSVTLRARLRFDSIIRRQLAGLDQAILRDWRRRVARTAPEVLRG